MTRRPSPRLRLRTVRSHRDWSEAELAERIRRLAAFLGQPDPNITAEMVREWEAGALVAPARLSLWSAVLGVPLHECLCLLDTRQLPEMLTIADVAGSVGPREEMVERRVFLRLLATASTTIALDPARLEVVLAERAHIDLATVAGLAVRGQQLAGLFGALPPPVLYQALLGHTESIKSLLAGPLPPGMRRELLAAGGHAAAFTGMAARQLGRDGEARSHLLLADQLSGAAGDSGTQALGLTWSADTLSGVQAGTGAVPEQAAVVRMMERAVELAGHWSPASVRAFTLLRLAEEQAASGDGRGAEVSLERAAAAEDVSHSAEPGLYGLGWGGAIAQDAFRASVNLLSGRPAAAAATLEGLLGRMPPEYISARSAALADLAAAHARQGDLEQAVSLLGSAWSVADEAGLEDRRRRVRGVRRRDLATYATEPAVRRLDEQLGATG